MDFFLDLPVRRVGVQQIRGGDWAHKASSRRGSFAFDHRDDVCSYKLNHFRHILPDLS